MNYRTSRCHFDVTKTIQKNRDTILLILFLPQYIEMVKQFDVSMGLKSRIRRKLGQYNFGLPFEIIAVDTAARFPVTDDRSRYIMIIVYYCTNWVQAYATDKSGLPLWQGR